MPPDDLPVNPTPPQPSDHEGIQFLRWSARLIGVLLAAFFLFMFIGESVETRDHYSPMDAMTVVRLAPAFAYAIAMFLAFKWERAAAILGGASLATLALIIAFFVPHDHSAVGAIGASIVALAFSFPVILYALCWWLEERNRKHHGATL